MDPQAERPRERALLALAAALILAASSRVTLPVALLAGVVVLLALPMALLIAWMSRGDTPPADEDGDGDGGTYAVPGPDGEPLTAEVLPFTRVPADPLPRPVRPDPPARRISA